MVFLPWNLKKINLPCTSRLVSPTDSLCSFLLVSCPRQKLKLYRSYCRFDQVGIYYYFIQPTARWYLICCLNEGRARKSRILRGKCFDLLLRMFFGHFGAFYGTFRTYFGKVSSPTLDLISSLRKERECWESRLELELSMTEVLEDTDG